MRKVKFPVVKNGTVFTYPDDIALFRNTNIVGETIYADYYGSDLSIEDGEYSLPTFDVVWTDIVGDVGSPNAVIELNMDYDDMGTNCVLLVVKVGSIETGKNSIIITATTTSPGAGVGVPLDYAVPLNYSNKNRDPCLVSAEILDGVITAEAMFLEPTYLYCTNESINRNQPYEIFKLNKPLHIRIVAKK